MDESNIFKGVLSFYKFGTEDPIYRQKVHVRIPQDIQELAKVKTHISEFLGIKDLAMKYDLGHSLDISLFKCQTLMKGKRENFAINTNDQWTLEREDMEKDMQSNELNSKHFVLNFWSMGLDQYEGAQFCFSF